MKNWSIKKLKCCRYLSYWLYVLFTVGTPVLLVAWQFDIFEKPSPVQLTGWSIVALIIAFFIFGKHIKRAVAELETGITKTVLQNFSMIVPFFIFWIVLTFLETYVSKVRFIIFWVMIGLAISAFLDLWHTGIIKELKRREK